MKRATLSKVVSPFTFSGWSVAVQTACGLARIILSEIASATQTHIHTLRYSEVVWAVLGLRQVCASGWSALFRSKTANLSQTGPRAMP